MKINLVSCQFKKDIKESMHVMIGLSLGFIMALFPLLTEALDKNIKISEQQLSNLGVIAGHLNKVSQVPVLYAPAKVVLPAKHEYVITASQAGLITKLNAAIGDKVKKGEVLAQLNSPDLLSSQRLYIKANNELALQKLSYQRDQKLFDEGIIAERRFLETRSVYNSMLAEANERRQLLQIAGMTDAEINQLTKSLQLSGLLSIRTPISGVVLERLVMAGTRVDSLVPLYRIGDLEELWLEINIPQERIGQVKIGDKVILEKSFATAANEEQGNNSAKLLPLTAEIALLGENVNAENQTILARAVIKGHQDEVRPGQRVNIQIIQPYTSSLFSVPNNAIAQYEGQTFIFVRNEEGYLAHLVKVQGKQNEESIVSSSDLSGNETIAVKGAVALKANWLGLGSSE